MPQTVAHVDGVSKVPSLVQAMCHQVGGQRCAGCSRQELSRSPLVFVPVDGGQLYCEEHVHLGRMAWAATLRFRIPIRLRLSALAV
jgi:hypothetical protein